MKNRIYFFMAGVLLCLLLGGCHADRALSLEALSSDEAEMSGEETETGQFGTQAEPGTKENGTIYVHVCGAVKTPQVVVLPVGSRGFEAVEAAGGFAEAAALDAVNLAKCLEDGEQLYIPTQGEAAEAESERRAAEDGLVDINRADAAQLCTLPGIGEARAEAIISYREANGGFQAPEDIMQVPGIKEGAYAKIKDKIVVR